MGKTALVEKRKVNSKDALTDKQRAFATYYVKYRNAGRAAREVGLSSKTAYSSAAKWLDNPKVQAEIGKLEWEFRQKVKVDIGVVLEQLLNVLTRDAADFVDENGLLVTDLTSLPYNLRCSVDGIKQKRRTWIDHDGNEQSECTTELKLVPKASAIEMAMRHKGLFAPQQLEASVALNLDKLYASQGSSNVIDSEVVPYNTKLHEKQKRLEESLVVPDKPSYDLDEFPAE